MPMTDCYLFIVSGNESEVDMSKPGTVGELIEHLEKFDLDRPIMVSDGADMYDLDYRDFEIWEESDSLSPIVYYIRD